MYEPYKNVHSVDYWYLSSNSLDPDRLLTTKKTIVDQNNFMSFSGQAADSLVIEFEP